MTSNIKILKILKGYVVLSEREKVEFVQSINEYIKSDGDYQNRMKNYLKTTFYNEDLGPTHSNQCPCCGKS